MSVTDVTEAVVEAAEIVPTQADNRIRAAVFVIGGVLIGASTGYFLGKRLTAKKYETILAEEIADFKESYKKLNKVGEYATPEATVISLGREKVDAILSEAKDGETVEVNVSEVEEYEQTVEDLGYSDSHRDDRPNLTVVNVFEAEKNDPELGENGIPKDAEERDPTIPYVISIEEFMEQDDFDKSTIAYYADDETLVDEAEEIVADVDEMVGLENLTRFGEQSQDPSVVYIRNELIHTDFEVCLNEGSYAEAIGMSSGRAD